MIASFPNFTPLTLDDREEYERFVQSYPPFSDISFATLHIWWNLEGKLEVCELNGNLIISYYQSFDELNSGLSLVGQNRVDESVKILLEHQKKVGYPVRLVHVPQFVVDKLEFRDGLDIEEELDYNEYILDSQALASLENPIHGRTRRKVKRFLREVENRKVEIKELDTSTPEARDQILKSILSWETNRSSDNDPHQTEHHAIKKTLSQSPQLGIKNLGLYIDENLCAVFLYHTSHDKQYYIMNHLKVDYSIPFIFDYMTHTIADRAVRENINFLNMEMDLGIENLRRHKLGLRPVDFFRKYTISQIVNKLL